MSISMSAIGSCPCVMLELVNCLSPSETPLWFVSGKHSPSEGCISVSLVCGADRCLTVFLVRCEANDVVVNFDKDFQILCVGSSSELDTVVNDESNLI